MAAEVYKWNKHESDIGQVRFPNGRVEIDNESFRDGLQGTQVSHHPTTEQISQYLVETERLGYSDHFDIGYPGSTGHKPRVIELVNFTKEKNLDLTMSAAGRASAIDDVKAVIEVAQSTGFPIEADLFLDISLSRAESEGWDREAMLEKMRENIILTKKEGLSVMFVPERASVTPPIELFNACKIAADAGADRIAIADTTGRLSPRGTTNIFRAVFSEIGSRYPHVKWDFHEHGDLQMGVANSLVAAEEGVDRLHVASRAIGERAGNVALEQLLVVLHLEELRDVDTTQIQKFAQMAANMLSVPIRPHEAIVGPESASTASGIHARGYEKNLEIYSPFPGGPEFVGLEPLVRIGPMSSLANVNEFCKQLGIEPPTEEKGIEILTLAKHNWGLLEAEDVKGILGRNGLR